MSKLASKIRDMVDRLKDILPTSTDKEIEEALDCLNAASESLEAELARRLDRGEYTEFHEALAAWRDLGGFLLRVPGFWVVKDNVNGAERHDVANALREGGMTESQIADEMSTWKN